METVLRRPLSISIIAWILIICSLISLGVVLYHYFLNNPLLRALMQQSSSLPVHLQYLFAFTTTSINVITGIGLLKRQNWARFLYLITCLISYSISIITTHVSLTAIVPGISISIIYIFFFFRKNANDYFMDEILRKF